MSCEARNSVAVKRYGIAICGSLPCCFTIFKYSKTERMANNENKILKKTGDIKNDMIINEINNKPVIVLVIKFFMNIILNNYPTKNNIYL